jgi:ABC-type glycerol-3-phosphate transport system permease component
MIAGRVGQHLGAEGIMQPSLLKRLEGLFQELMDAAELRRFVTNLYGKRVTSQLPGEGITHELLSHGVVTVLSRNGLIDREFFVELLGERPRMRTHILDVAAEFGVATLPVEGPDNLPERVVRSPDYVVRDTYESLRRQRQLVRELIHGELHLARLFGNTIFITALTVAIVLALSTTAAWGVVRYRKRWGEAIFLLILLGLMVPPAAVLLPFFVVMRDLHAYNHLYAVVLAEAAFALPFGILLIRGYFEQLPRELSDAARVDGAGEWRSFWHVTLPLVTPALMTLATIVVLATWNGFIFPLILLNDPRSGTLTTALSTFSTATVTQGISTQVVAAGAVLAAAPVVALLILGRRAYVSGITSGALKQ